MNRILLFMGGLLNLSGPLQDRHALPLPLDGNDGFGRSVHVVHSLCRKPWDFATTVVLCIHVLLPMERAAGDRLGKNCPSVHWDSVGLSNGCGDLPAATRQSSLVAQLTTESPGLMRREYNE